MTIPLATPPTQDDRIMAALAHATALLPFMGIVAPILIWTTQKDKSPFVSFQALQALVYQLTMLLAWFLGMFCYMCSFFGSFLGIAAAPAAEESADPLSLLLFLIPTFFPFIIFGLIFLGGIAFITYGLVAAVMILQGRDFRYVIIGQRLERYLRSTSS